jgi:hypothetical protein
MKTSEPQPRGAFGAQANREDVENRASSTLLRPVGETVGYAVGETPAESFAGRPRGHVVGRAVGVAPVESFAGRPRGHVVGRAVGVAPVESFAGRPRGHVVGNAICGETPALSAWPAVGPGASQEAFQTSTTTGRKAA